VDVVLVLLIIFMVTANFIVRETVEVDLPRAAHGGETVQGLVNVVLDKEGKLYFDGAEVTEVSLVAGQTYRRPAGIRHDVMNASPHPVAFVETEFKSGRFDLAGR